MVCMVSLCFLTSSLLPRFEIRVGHLLVATIGTLLVVVTLVRYSCRSSEGELGLFANFASALAAGEQEAVSKLVSLSP